MIASPPKQRECCQVAGQFLRQAREQKNLSLEEAAHGLGMPLRHLEALEEGQLQIFSAAVYARGAFMKYATYLGVNARQSNKLLWQALSELHEVTPLRLLTPRTWLQRVITPRFLIMVVGLLAALTVGSYIGWQVQFFLRLPKVALLEPASAIMKQSKVTIRGQAEINANVKVNGQVTLLQPDGSFEVPLVLHPGINHLEIEAENAAARKRIIQKDLLLPRKSR